MGQRKEPQSTKVIVKMHAGMRIPLLVSVVSQWFTCLVGMASRFVLYFVILNPYVMEILRVF
jgi:hypothetical protein